MEKENFYPKVSVVIPAFNEEFYIEKVLKSIEAQTYPRELIQVIVVDNNSTDSTKDISLKYADLVLTLNDGPVGNVRNYGVQNSSSEIIFFIDADCIAPKKWITHGVEFLLENKDAALGGGYLLREKPYFIEKYWLLNEGNKPTELVGGAIAIPKKIFNQVGGFDIKITSGEDSKLKKDLISSDFRVVLDQSFSVVHLGNPTKATQFIKRQIWHSENYFKNISESIIDPVFLTTLLFVSSFFMFLATGFNWIFLSGMALSTVVLSLKRIIKARQFKFLFKLPFCMYLDFLYLIGRSIGIVKGIAKIFKNKG